MGTTFFDRILLERGSNLEIADFVCVRMLDENFSDLEKNDNFLHFCVIFADM